MFSKRIIFSFILTFSFLYIIEAQRRIFKSEIAMKGQFPYAGYINYEGAQTCGAVIIHKRWALTATHCINPGKAPTLVVGTNVLSTDNSRGKKYGLEDIILHEQYNHEHNQNDIALLRTGTDIRYNNGVQPVVLPKDLLASHEGDTAILAGWGNITPAGKATRDLRYGIFEIISQDECAKNITDDGFGLFITHLCAYGNEGVDPCSGDSGSPMTVNDILVGILIAGGKECGKADIPALLMRVAPYMPWIREKLRIYNDNLP